MSKERRGSKTLTETAVRLGSKTRKEKMSTQVVLLKAGLEEYYIYFDKAGHKFMDSNTYQSDEQVEQLLEEVEAHNSLTFLPDARVLLWKAFRYHWFRGPGHVRKFIERSEVPKVFLPKLDYKMVDSMIKMSDIDPDRQRQMIRKTKPSGSLGFRGPAVITLQFEVFKRQRDINYELKDLERCVSEWQNRNPRMMTHEDPREMVLKLRIRRLEDTSKLELEARHVVQKEKWRISMLLYFMRMVCAGLSVLMLLAALYRYRNSPTQLLVEFVTGSKQFLSMTSFLMAYFFIFGVAQRRHPDVIANKLERLMVSCQRMKEAISDFRVETEEFRLEDESIETAFGLITQNAKVAPKKKAAKETKSRDLNLGEDGARRRGKKKTKKDPTLAMWCGPDAHKKISDPIDLMESVARSLAESAKRGRDNTFVDNANRYCGGGDGDRMEHHFDRARPAENFEDRLHVSHVQARQASRAPTNLTSLSDSPASLALPPQPVLPGPPGGVARELVLSQGQWPSNPQERRSMLGESQSLGGSTRAEAAIVTPMPAPPAAAMREAARRAAEEAPPSQPRLSVLDFEAAQRAAHEDAANQHTGWLPGSLPDPS